MKSDAPLVSRLLLGPPLPEPPEGTTPDRNEVITCLGDGETFELEPGVEIVKERQKN